MKKFRIVALVLALAMVVGIVAACTPETEELKGVTETTIYVGNTAGTTGALTAIGVPFNTGIEAAFYEYNQKGGFDGKNVELKHYDDGGVPAQSKTLTERLLNDDEVFAIVGNFAATCVAANLQSIKEADAPMVYAAAGNDELFNEHATGADRNIMPVQPLNNTEGRVMLFRAVAPKSAGGLGYTKVGVLSNNTEASQAMLAGIKAEEAGISGVTITYQNVAATAGGNYAPAMSAFKNAGCEVVLMLTISNEFLSGLTAMDNASYYPDVITSYNNANQALFNDATTGVLNPTYKNVLTNSKIYAQAWLDTTSTTYFYTTPGALFEGWKLVPGSYNAEKNGIGGFTEDFWKAAQAIFDYCASKQRADGFEMSYNSYALAGYIAGNLFCQGLDALKAAGKTLTRANYVDIMESKAFHVPMADTISYENGRRFGVSAFALNLFSVTAGASGETATMSLAQGLKDIEAMRVAMK